MVQDTPRDTPIIGFIHCYTVNNWAEILKEQVKKISKCGLYAKADAIYIGTVGPPSVDTIRTIMSLPSKFKVMFHMEDPEINDSLTLAMMHQKSMTFEGAMFYIHSKGVTHIDSLPQKTWRNYMEHFIIQRHPECLKQLEWRVDLVGVNWRSQPNTEAKSKLYGELIYQPVTPHFSGNFFWANSSYIRTLPRLFPIQGRYDCEFWVGQRNPRVACLWESGIKHHRNPYPTGFYADNLHITYYRGDTPI